ncbi:hypothetical protein [Burkholderia sp. Nafp2/4-1b]|uniref:hypothetical protein n=1 Tax=Burkholderia sp. Nafp2/4-1b TaxID=2116686 RepID=UPI0013CF1CA0|nr:hypothetical protein [Burkholderia sp. Nafp2/4-1b]
MSILAELASTPEASRRRTTAVTRGVSSLVSSVMFDTCDVDSRDNRTCCPVSS